MPLAGQWKEKVRNAKRYNLTATLYDRLYRDEQESKNDSILTCVKIIGGERILDVGCGTGLLIQRLVEKKGDIIGIDFSKEMLAEAKKGCSGHENVSLVCGDADFLPLREGTIDKIFALTLLQNVPRPKQTLFEVIRVAKNNAEIILTWQKRLFKDKSLTESLENCGLEVKKLIDDERLKDYIHICKKH